ncbi:MULTISPECIES: fimbrial protein [Acinetobacter]|uniref:fimbrial protein n=1 Tax=Acinetobacter TaxID=469 RepID=UPI0002AE8E44|nr:MULTISPECIES: fimbrial protein [Acinetobacter]ELW86508.1 fimbrial protein [Acinetobacter sp. WC-743]MBJ8427993.1 fimbrial protein [Acinetobacter bereziniae]MBJ8474977.1 fimbrial protein [Acinetobacter bereziniae]MBO3652833.1 fimbrial protein [Acinetobacter bereziniae]MDV8157846.1 fimbrial protein [Acinetobacter bereziniae]
MKNQLFASALLLFTTVDIYAGWWRTEQKGTIYADFGTYTFTDPSQNQAGSTFGKTLNVNINGDSYYTNCNNGTNLNGSEIEIYMTSDYVNGLPINIGGKQYTQVNDYLQASVSYSYSNQVLPVPSVNRYFGYTAERCYVRSSHVGNTNFSLTMRISKPFMGFSNVDVPVANFYTGDNASPAGSGKANGAKQILHLRGKVMVPQSCEINGDQESIHDFGDIGSYAFKRAGVGNQIQGISKANISLLIKCNSFVAVNAPMTLRVQADNVGGPANDMIVSNNPDVGFKISDQNDRLLIPNNTNSKIQFNNTNPANIVLKAWPVSVTGAEPKPGAFQARGYFRIDFD